jgi:DNA-binding SARP family transcriptional activator
MKHRAGPRRHTAASRTSMDQLSLFLLGGFDLRHGDRSIWLPSSAERLVAFLAVHGGSPNRSFVAGNLWPETREDRAAGNLRSTLWRLRRVGHRVVDSSATQLWLRADVRVDLHRLKEIIRKALDEQRDLRRNEVATLLAPADLLPGWYEEWVLLERERLRQLRLHALEGLCEWLIEGRRFGLAVEAGMAAVSEEPLRESPRRVLIRAHIAEGNASEALREYRQYRQLLQDELGLDPSPEMEGLLEALPTR